MARLGFHGAAEAWESNPLLEVSVNPGDFRVVSPEGGSRGILKNTHQGIHQLIRPASHLTSVFRVYQLQYEQFVSSYVECLLWADTPEGKEWLPEELSPSLQKQIGADCLVFFQAHYEAIKNLFDQAGHDFFLSRNGHGSGFSDRDPAWYGGQQDALQDAARAFGETDLYEGDDGLIYSMG